MSDLNTATGMVIVTEDSTAPYNCTGAPVSTGSTTITPLPFDQDSDGDGCTDWYELGENPELGGLNDPFNPNDCDGIAPGGDVMTPDGLYEIGHEFANGYRRCMGAVNTGLSMDVYCYTDSTSVPINPEAYGSVSGDGLPGAPPPGPCPAPDPNCTDDFPNVAYGDVNGTHTTLQGSLNGGMLTFTGCFEDLDGQDPLGHIYVEWTWDVQTGAGDSDMWTGQSQNACTSGSPQGSPDAGELQAMKLATTQQMNACYAVAGVCPFADNDPPVHDRNGDGLVNDLDAGDGVPDHRELRDDRDVNDPNYPNVPAPCGLRDPFNINDYYDVSIPRDGIIDTLSDILGVNNNFQPVGYTAGAHAIAGPGTMENYDRPLPMTDGAGGWSRGDPDGKIDLLSDITGVIGQFNPTGCNGP